jgi:ABC-type transport system involved in Fe-S cluster assembly fused permease/ATPase subunit
MFNESIYYNIAYGKQGATQQEVEAAAKSAFMDKFIEALPQGPPQSKNSPFLIPRLCLHKQKKSA